MTAILLDINLLVALFAGHQQVNDAHLPGLAMRRKGELANFDRSIASLLPKGTRKSDWIVELST